MTCIRAVGSTFARTWRAPPWSGPPGVTTPPQRGATRPARVHRRPRSTRPPAPGWRRSALKFAIRSGLPSQKASVYPRISRLACSVFPFSLWKCCCNIERRWRAWFISRTGDFASRDMSAAEIPDAAVDSSVVKCARLFLWQQYVRWELRFRCIEIGLL